MQNKKITGSVFWLEMKKSQTCKLLWGRLQALLTYSWKIPFVMDEGKVEEESSYDEYGGVKVFYLWCVNDGRHDQIARRHEYYYWQDYWHLKWYKVSELLCTQKFNSNTSRLRYILGIKKKVCVKIPTDDIWFILLIRLISTLRMFFGGGGGLKSLTLYGLTSSLRVNLMTINAIMVAA